MIYELDAAQWIDALYSYLTLLQRAGLVSFKRSEKYGHYRFHTPTELPEKSKKETKIFCYLQEVSLVIQQWKFRGQRKKVEDYAAFQGEVLFRDL